MQVKGMICLLDTLSAVNHTKVNRFHFGVTLFSR